jgi:hypothetical protein
MIQGEFSISQHLVSEFTDCHQNIASRTATWFSQQIDAVPWSNALLTIGG